VKTVPFSPEVAQFLGSVNAKLSQHPPEPVTVGWRAPRFGVEDPYRGSMDPQPEPQPSYYSDFRPDVQLRGGMRESNIPVYLPDNEVNIERDKFDVSGRVGFRGRTQNDSRFGFGASGDWGRQWLDFPYELQQFGEPESMRTGRGVNVGALDAFYQTPGGKRFSARYNPGRGIYGGVTIPF
jgi:hypothetical protein